MSREWRHALAEPPAALGPTAHYGMPFCVECKMPWPCDAQLEHNRADREKARAIEADEARQRVVDGLRTALREAIGTDEAGKGLTHWHHASGGTSGQSSDNDRDGVFVDRLPRCEHGAIREPCVPCREAAKPAEGLDRAALGAAPVAALDPGLFRETGELLDMMIRHSITDMDDGNVRVEWGTWDAVQAFVRRYAARLRSETPEAGT